MKNGMGIGAFVVVLSTACGVLHGQAETESPSSEPVFRLDGRALAAPRAVLDWFGALEIRGGQAGHGAAALGNVTGTGPHST